MIQTFVAQDVRQYMKYECETERLPVASRHAVRQNIQMQQLS